MQSILDTLVNFIMILLGLIVTAVTFVEMLGRAFLNALGIHGSVQTVLLIGLFVALVVLAFRVFGRLLAVLLTAAILVWLFHALLGVPHALPFGNAVQEKTITL